MNNPSRLSDAAMARAEMDTYEQAITPYHDTIRRELGSLSIKQSLLEDERQEHAAGVANLELVKNFTSVLPRQDEDAGIDQPRFRVDDYAQARLIQSKVVWWRGDWAHYVIGERPGPSDKWTQLLLADALYADNIMEVVVKTDRYMQNKEASEQRLTKPFDGDTKRIMHDPTDYRLWVTPNTPGSVQVEKVKRTRQSFTSGVPASTDIKVLLSDHTMRSYDVYNHLIKLAVDLGRQSELKTLLAARDATLAGDAKTSVPSVNNIRYHLVGHLQKTVHRLLNL